MTKVYVTQNKTKSKKTIHDIDHLVDWNIIYSIYSIPIWAIVGL